MSMFVEKREDIHEFIDQFEQDGYLWGFKRGDVIPTPIKRLGNDYSNSFMPIQEILMESLSLKSRLPELLALLVITVAIAKGLTVVDSFLQGFLTWTGIYITVALLKLASIVRANIRGNYYYRGWRRHYTWVSLVISITVIIKFSATESIQQATRYHSLP